METNHKGKKEKRGDLMKFEEFKYNLSVKYKSTALYNEWFLYPDTDVQCSFVKNKLVSLYRTGKAGIEQVGDLEGYFEVTKEVGRGIACMMGLGVADALGAST